MHTDITITNSSPIYSFLEYNIPTPSRQRRPGWDWFTVCVKTILVVARPQAAEPILQEPIMYYTPKDIERIADPAAGSGAYLKQTADLLANPPYTVRRPWFWARLWRGLSKFLKGIDK